MAPKSKAQMLTAEQRAAVARVLDYTTPHLSDVIEELANIAKHSRKEVLRRAAAAKIIELHLQACAITAPDPDAENGKGKVLVIQASTLDAVESLQREAQSLPAEGVPS